MSNHNECQCCDELRAEIKKLTSAFIDLNIDVRIQREYDHAREKLAAWIEATKNLVYSDGSERDLKRTAAINTLNMLNSMYFEVPHRRGKIQIALDAAHSIIEFHENTYKNNRLIKVK